MNTLSIAVIGVAVILLLAFVFHNKIIRLIARCTQALFFLGFLGLLSVAITPGLYSEFTDNLLEESYLGTQLHTLDTSLNEIDETKSKWQQEWNRFFGEDKKADNVPEAYQIYPSFVNLLSTGLLIFTGASSLLMMLLSIYFKYTFLGYMSVDKGLRKIKTLEKKIDERSFPNSQ